MAGFRVAFLQALERACVRCRYKAKDGTVLERASLLRAESEAASAFQQRGQLALEINGVDYAFDSVEQCQTFVYYLRTGQADLELLREILVWQVALQCAWGRRQRAR